jgi:hypothetical protein
MIRKAVIIVLTLAAVGMAGVWAVSFVRLDRANTFARRPNPEVFQRARWAPGQDYGDAVKRIDRSERDYVARRARPLPGLQRCGYVRDDVWLRAEAAGGELRMLAINSMARQAALADEDLVPWDVQRLLDTDLGPVLPLAVNAYAGHHEMWPTISGVGQHLRPPDWSSSVPPQRFTLAWADKTLPWRPKDKIRYTVVCVPLWALFALFAAYPTFAFIRGPCRRWFRRRRGLCIGCGYNLTGNVSGTCPECGIEVESS